MHRPELSRPESVLLNIKDNIMPLEKTLSIRISRWLI